MSDNVVKFRPIEKKPDPNKPKPGMPGWLPWLVLIAAAVAITAVQQAGWLGG
ncbi:hypothetical protein D3C80_2116810 [compost metagenome]|jgi:hypothetical protein